MEEAVVVMVDSNLQREQILPSEKAFAYKMKLDALRRQVGRPRKENGVPLGHHFSGAKSREWVCVCGAAPFAVLGFVSYHGMPAEKFAWVWFRSEVLEPKHLCFKPNNLYLELMKESIAKHEKEEYAHESHQASAAAG